MGARDLPEKLVKTAPGCYTWFPPPLLPSCTSIIFFGEPPHAPKWCFFNPVVILGLKKHHFGARAGTRKKIIEVQDKNRAKKGGYPPCEMIWAILAILGISCENGLQSWPSRESKPAEKTAHHPSGVISGVLPRVKLALQGPIRASGGPLR